jgi:hypothetical protein
MFFAGYQGARDQCGSRQLIIALVSGELGKPTTAVFNNNNYY